MKQRILIVNDEPGFPDNLQEILREYRSQWELSFAESVDEALVKAQEEAFDAIVSDIHMPGKSGFDLLHALNRDDTVRDTPVIILTGNLETDLKRQALDLGATDLLNKPVIKEDMIARLQSTLRLKWYQDELKAQNRLLEQKVRDRTADMEQAHRVLIWSLANAGEFLDEETGDHVVRVAQGSRVLAEALDLTPEEIEAIFLVSSLHDIGKVGIPDGILLKEGKLSPEERKIMEKHCEIGAAILTEEPKGIPALTDNHLDLAIQELTITSKTRNRFREMAATIALTHHEKWDGSGYPYGLKGEKIPVAGLIVGIIDVYDALRSNRPYKGPFSPGKALAIMREDIGSHFSPQVFDQFEKKIDVIEDIRQKYLD